LAHYVEGREHGGAFGRREGEGIVGDDMVEGRGFDDSEGETAGSARIEDGGAWWHFLRWKAGAEDGATFVELAKDGVPRVEGTRRPREIELGLSRIGGFCGCALVGSINM